MKKSRNKLTPEAKVGMFWCIGNTVVGEAVPLDKAEPYGDALQYGGHYDYWSELKPQTETDRRFKSHAYDYYPRGRVVYFQSRQQFRLYVDKCLSDENRKSIADYFSLDLTQIEIETDAHYQCAECNRGYLE